MKKRFYVFSLLILISCSNSKLMNAESFSCVSMGMTEKELVSTAGKPYNICKHNDGSLEYEYIERFEEANNRRTMQINYFITIKNGVVTHKRVQKCYTPGWMYDSLNYQSKNE